MNSEKINTIIENYHSMKRLRNEITQLKRGSTDLTEEQRVERIEYLNTRITSIQGHTVATYDQMADWEKSRVANHIKELY